MRAPWLVAALVIRGVACVVAVGVTGCGVCDALTDEEAAPVAAVDEASEPRPPPPPPPRSTYPEVKECPERLAGIELTMREIPAGCGPVRVAPGYRIDAGGLTIGAGVILEFEAGASLGLGFLKETAVSIRGEPGAPVILRVRPPEPEAPATRRRGAPERPTWAGIRLYPGARGAHLEHVILEDVGHPDKGAIYSEAEELVVKHVELRRVSGLAVYVNGEGSLRRFTDNTLDVVEGSTAMFLPAPSMAALTADNVIPEGSTIRLLGGHLRGHHRWIDPGVPVIVGGRVEIAGTPDAPAIVTFAPGLDLRFERDGYINVGYYDPGVLIAVGTPSQPIVFTADGAGGPGSWRGVNLYKHATVTLSHVVFEGGARYIDRGVLYANSAAEISMSDVLFRGNRAGIVFYRGDLRLRNFSRVRFEATPRPLRIDPVVFGRLGDGNDFGGGMIVIDEGTIRDDALWRDPGVAVALQGPIAVEGATLTIDAGLEAIVDDGFGLEVGRRSPARLEIRGEAARPVTIRGANDRRGTWDAIHLYPTALGEAHRLRELRLHNAGGDAAVFVHPGGVAAIDGLHCERCFSPALSWDCGATVEVGAIAARDGTPATVRTPECGGS